MKKQWLLLQAVILLVRRMVLVMPHCDVLSKSAVTRIQDWQKKGGKIADAKIAALEKWVKMGAPAPAGNGNKLTGLTEKAKQSLRDYFANPTNVLRAEAIEQDFSICSVSREAPVDAALGSVLALPLAAGPAQAWEPTKPVEFLIPAGPGGGGFAHLLGGRGARGNHRLRGCRPVHRGRRRAPRRDRTGRSDRRRGER